jgi:hypothetical protein
MEHTATFVAIAASVLVSMLIAIALPLFFSGENWKASQENARARRMTDAKMNARLLRFNL